ncbi:uncharacterized protein LOC26526571 [Drosophila erecta]|uniref:Uncharacterized protein n=1 Tax=Drosophila erecta TaxID=7220 RepID=A0A0Q5WCP9_DROER|nr:uncharacterized protein LOC26526571 [Drosophila erecta]KQS70964.1 uncharacterized protein Dere_GG26747 [Drosophila erecta]
MRIGVLIVVVCLQVYSALVILPLLTEVKGKLLNATANKIKKGISMKFNLGSLMEIFGESQQRNASSDNISDLFNAGLALMPK